MSAPTRLRLDASGRGSWWLPAGSMVQQAYAVRVSDWESGRRDSDQSVHVDLAAPAGPWQVRVWTDLGASDWSATAPGRVTTLPPVLDLAEWIEPAEPVIPPPGRRPVYLLRHEFTLTGPVAEATAWVTAHGIYELFVNGTRVGDEELTPGFTAYRRRLQVQHHDVAGLLRTGDNTVELLLSDGWFRGRHGFERTANGFGDRVAALLALDVSDVDGGTTAVVTGAGWWSRPSGIVADLMDGQHADLSPAEWQPAQPVSGGLYADRDRLVLPVAPPVRRIEELAPVAVTHPVGSGMVVDFGQNINGWVRVRAMGGDPLTLVHGERLDADGQVTTDHLRAFDFTTGQRLPAGQIDTVIPAGVVEPRHTTHGFRYVQIAGGEPDVTAVVVHTDLTETGWFRCSDERLEALHRAAVWSLRDNACDIPTDCPQRERSGFTGDWQVYVAAAARTHDVAAFSDKWLRDLAADQWPDGRVPTVTPNPAGAGPSGSAVKDAMEGSAGWGDAAVFVPWELWRAYGDCALLARQYDSMVRWVDYAAGSARDRRHPDRTGSPAPHERYLWDTGGHFGEWLEPGVPPALDPTADQGIVATAYLARSARLLARIARVLGLETDHDALADAVRDAWQREYLDGTIAVPTQANHVRALAFDLVPDGLRPAVAARLATLVRDNDHRVGTGFLSTGLLLPTLADTGYVDEAYRVLLSTGVPSWLGMVEQGATTMWERWEGDGSLNHYSKGAVISFLYSHVAGIRLPANPGPAEAGYRRFVVEPVPGGGLTWAEAEQHTPYGPVRSSWRVEAGRLRLTVDVPPGSHAEIRLPDGRMLAAPPGRHEAESAVSRKAGDDQ